MHKKLLISLVPLLATVAFVAMPAVAQAAPHYYSENKETKPGTKVPILAWGTLKLTNSAKPTEPIECENENGGFAENPTGGGAGKGETEGWTAYNCKNLPECEAAGGKIAVLMENEATPGLVANLKWGNELIEEEAKIKLLSKNVRVFVRCQIAALAPEETLFESGPAFVRSTTEIEAGGTNCTTNAAEGGIQHPTLSNGNEPAKPSKVVFVAGAVTGELACKVKNPAKPSEEVSSKGATSGSLKTMGYKEQETITTRGSGEVEKLPGGTTFNGNVHGTKVEKNKEVPTINWKQTTPITTHACKGGTVTVSVTAENTETHKIEPKEVTLTENPAGSGTFTGVIPELHPLHGPATVTIKATNCPEPSQDQTLEFPIYIDPSGKVVDGAHEDVAVEGATVTLLSSPTLTGTYTAVPNGSTVMSPTNRVNPDMSSEGGQYGWEVEKGFYKIQATKAGCGTATTAAFEVPPEEKNIELVLHCEA